MALAGNLTDIDYNREWQLVMYASSEAQTWYTLVQGQSDSNGSGAVAGCVMAAYARIDNGREAPSGLCNHCLTATKVKVSWRIKVMNETSVTGRDGVTQAANANWQQWRDNGTCTERASSPVVVATMCFYDR